MKSDFRERVFDVVKNIQTGATMSYGEVAAKAGNKKAARAVGSILRRNFDTRVPCHRVIRSDGNVGHYNRGGANKKILLLQTEGVRVKNHE